jgi:hypothetical protein
MVDIVEFAVDYTKETTKLERERNKMPCTEIRTTTCKLENCDADILVETLKGLGLYIRHDENYIWFGNNEYVDLKNKTLRISSYRNVKEIKGEFMRTALKTKMQKAGFTVESVKQQVKQQLRIY